MNFQAMRQDGYSDTDIVESLRSSELFRDTADFDAFRKKGFNDTQIIDFLDATPSFHEVTTARREKAKAEQPTQTPTAPQNNEGDVEGLGDTAVPPQNSTLNTQNSPAPDAPTMPQEETKSDNGFTSWIKEGGKEILKGLGFLNSVVSGEEHKEAFKDSAKLREKQIASMEDGVAKASVEGINTGLNTLGHMADAGFNPVDYAMGAGNADAYSSPSGIDKKQATQIATLYNPTEKSLIEATKDFFIGEDNPLGMSEDQVKERIENVAKILNKPIDDVVIDTNPKSETYGVPYVKDKNGEFQSTKSESVWENMSVEMESDFLTILAQIGTDKAGWDAGGKIGDKIAKSIPNKYLASLVKGGSRILGSALSSTAATPLGTIAQKDKNAYQTGVYEDGDAYVSEAWRDMKDNFATTIAGGVALEGVVAGAKGAKGAYTVTKDYLTGDMRSYQKMLSDFKVDEQYAKDALSELNTMMEKPLEDSRLSRMYAMALKHEQGLKVLRASLYRNTEAYNTIEAEALERTKQLKQLLEDKVLKPAELDSFLKAASDEASRQYQSMRDVFRGELSGANVTFDKQSIADFIDSDLVVKIIDPTAKEKLKNISVLIKDAPYMTSTVDGLIEFRQLINKEIKAKSSWSRFTAPDKEVVNKLIEGIDAAIYKAIDDTVGEEDARVLKNIFETAKADFSAEMKSQASDFFKTLTRDLDSPAATTRKLTQGLKADSGAADFVLARLSTKERERLELTAIHETIQKTIHGESGGVKTAKHEDIFKGLSELEPNMKSQIAKDTIEMVKKLNTVFAKDSSLILDVTDKANNSLAMNLVGKVQFGIWSKMFEFMQRHLPTKKAANLHIYNRLGKYMETSHNSKQLALKMYNDPLVDVEKKAFWGKYIHYYNKNDSDGMAKLMDTIPEPPKGGGSGLMDEAEIDELSRNAGKTPTAEELKARLDDEAKAFKPDDTNPPDDNGGGGSPKPTKEADNGVQGEKEALKRQSVEEIESTTGKTLDQLGDEDGFYTHYSTHEFDTLSSNGAKDAGNLGQTKGKETNENHVINVTFGYKKGARVENEHGIGLAGQHEYKIDLRGRTFFDDNKHKYFFKKVQELKDASPELSDEALHVKAKEALGYDDATVDTIVDFQKRYNVMRQVNPNQTTKDTQNSVLKEMKLDGIGNKNHLEIFEDAPVYKVRTLEHDIDYAGMKRTRSMDNLPPVSKGGDMTSVKATIEATPSSKDPMYAILKAMSYDERETYEKAHIPLVKALAKSHGLDVDVVVSKGAYVNEGVMQNNPVMVVSFKKGTLERRVLGEVKTIPLEMRLRDNGYGGFELQQNVDRIEAFLKDFGAGTNQDSVPWYAPIFNSNQKGIHGYVSIVKDISQDEFEAMSKQLMNEHGSLNPQIIDGQLRIMDFNEVPIPLDLKNKMIHNAIEPLVKSGKIDNKVLEFDSIGKLLIQGEDYERRILLHESESATRRPNIPEPTDSHNAGDEFAKGVQELRRGLQERPKLDGGQKTVQDPIGTSGGTSGGVQTLSVTPQQAGEQLASDLKNAPPSTFKGGYVRPEVLSFMTKTLTGATGGSLTEYDYNQDGKIDFKDRAIGAALGVVGFHALTSQPAFSAYKALANHGIKQLETRAEQGDLIAQMALGTRYIYASAKAGERGAFSDILTKQTMKEIDDSGAKLTRNLREIGGRDYIDLSEVIDHPELFKRYPQLKDVVVNGGAEATTKDAIASFNPLQGKIIGESEEGRPIKSGMIEISKDANLDAMLHEIQHVIQGYEKWPKGSSLDNTGWDDYMRHYGEQQSRAVEYRKNMTPEQRAKESWWQTLERVEGNVGEPIIKYDDGVMMSVKYNAPFEDKLNDIRTFFKDNVDKKTLKADEKELYEFVMGNQNFLDFFTENIRTVLPRGNDAKGFKHFIIRHYGEGAESELSAWDVLRIGKTIMNGTKLTDAEISKNIEKLGHAKDAFRRSVTTKDGDYVYVVGVEEDKRNGDNMIITYYKTKIGDLGDSSKPPVGKQA